jgi:nucleoside-diphosphate-sugar epimerase
MPAPVRILVTGGCGFIGSNLVPLLLERGADVVVLDSFAIAGPERLPDGVGVREGDVRDPGALAGAVEGAEAVIHLAAAGNVSD